MYSKWASKGFSIAEMIIVVVVLGILAGIVIISYAGFQERSRDSERTSHLTQLKVALDKYYAENSQYPSICTADGTECDAEGLAGPLAEFIDKIPADPRYGAGETDSYQYVREGTSGNAYGLRVMYEEKEPCVDGVRIEETWWSGTYPEC